MSLSLVATEILYVRRLLASMGMAQTRPTLLLCDNEAAILLANEPKHTEATRHIATRYHFIANCVVAQELVIKHTDGNFNLADLQTKITSQPTFTRLTDRFMDKQ